MMAFIDSVFHVIGSFISMVFEAIVAAVQFGFSVLGGLLYGKGSLDSGAGGESGDAAAGCRAGGAGDYAPQKLQAVEGG